jgi:cellulose synthase/poly-beta-1,6-N-acetylglucosamine synthase-like glycosyltransferase
MTSLKFYREKHLDRSIANVRFFLYWISILILVAIFSFVVTPSADASFCRQLGDRQICILSIERSAKNYWEYRAAVSINGVTKPIEIYNCRSRQIVQKDRTALDFPSNSAGDLICSQFDYK